MLCLAGPTSSAFNAQLHVASDTSVEPLNTVCVRVCVCMCIPYVCVSVVLQLDELSTMLTSPNSTSRLPRYDAFIATSQAISELLFSGLLEPVDEVPGLSQDVITSFNSFPPIVKVSTVLASRSPRFIPF